ncbi:helix-turn-helix domain-containing protein [Peribacillus sp. YIM B13482]|uniref:helix-turn-helix domain-containing protein n=1 Tax=Peribacillus sp. YIM B13482 TaxID=3366298 RepID=UPI00366FA1BB
MTNNTPKIKGTHIRCKGNVEKNYEQVPHSIFSYLGFGLISGNELAVYILLLKNDNNQKRYAFPTVNQLAIWTGITPRTVKAATKRLEIVGLIRKEKASGYANKNRYYVNLPHEKEVLEKLVPELKAKLDLKISKLEIEAEQDKQRLEVISTHGRDYKSY